MLIPYQGNVADVEIDLKEEIVELKIDETVQSLFYKGKLDVWKNKDISCKYPLLQENSKTHVIVLTSSYIVESGFSRLTHLLKKKNRNRVDLVKRGDLRLTITKLEADFKMLI